MITSTRGALEYLGLEVKPDNYPIGNMYWDAVSQKTILANTVTNLRNENGELLQEVIHLKKGLKNMSALIKASASLVDYLMALVPEEKRLLKILEAADD